MAFGVVFRAMANFCQAAYVAKPPAVMILLYQPAAPGLPPDTGVNDPGVGGAGNTAEQLFTITMASGLVEALPLCVSPAFGSFADLAIAISAFFYPGPFCGAEKWDSLKITWLGDQATLSRYRQG